MTNENTSIDAAIAAVQKGKERDYWFNRFADVPGKVTFPYDIPTGIGTGSQDARVEFQWTGELFEKLHTVMKGSDYKLYMILMAGLILLLNKYSGQDDITVGTPVLKQELEVKFINTMLALRNHIDTDIAFKDFLLQVRQTVIEGTENQNYPLQSLLNLLNLTEKEGESFPLFDTAILLTGIHDKNYLKDFRVNTLFLFTRTGNHITGELQYNSRLYDQVTMANLVNHFGFLLQDALGNPGKKLKSVEITGEVEKERLICQLNNTAIDFPLQQTIGNVFAGCAGKVSHRLAAVYEENQITYRELHEKSNLLAVFLKKRGIGDGDIVGLMVDRSLEMLIGILGILKAGGAYLPIDSEYPGDRNLFLLKDSRARLLLWQKSLMRLEKNSHLRAYFPGQFTIPLDDPAVYENPGSSLEMSGCPANPAYVIYTSGTTGVPKGVMVEHRHVLNLVYGLEQRIYKYYQNHLHVCMVSPYVFDASVKQIFTVLILGHTLHIVSQQTRTDALRLIEYYFRHRIEISDGTPTHISLLSENLRGSQREIIEGFPVRRFIIGGEALSKQVVEQFLAIFGVNPPGITNVYGPTECTVDAASFDILPQNLHLYRSIVIGKPMPNFQIYILDREGLLQPVGVSGELCIGGSGVSRGYLNRPELTAEKFRPQITQMAQMTLMKNKNSTLRADLNAFGDEKNFSHSAFDLPRIQHSNLYCTGDLARWLHDGCLEYLGRIDRQVKIRGFRVELGEIENALLQHEAVKAVVVTVKDDRENDSMICAYIVFTAALSSNDLRDFLAGRLPYYLIPQYFIPIEKIPLTWNGKVDHKALPAPGIKTGQEIILPRNQQEEKLLSAWSEVLKIEKEKISIADDFFALGGHSLKAALMVARVHKILDVKVPLGVVFANPTIHSLAEYISHTAKSRFTVIEPAPVKDYYALSSAQKRLYIQQQLQPESTEYNLPVVMLKIKGLPDIQRLEQAFQNLVQRHESFRTGFQVIEGEPMQKIEPGINFQIDYYSMPEAEARPFINRYIRPFDLSRAPLLRAGLIQIDPQTHILMVDMHHIITDATSTQIFIKDLLAFYAGETLPPIPISYKDFSEWHHRLLHSGEIAKQEAYWLNEFSGPIPVLNLPTDEERPPVRSFAGDTLSFALNKQETAGLNQIAQTNNVTLYMILMAVFYVFLHKLSGQEDIIIGADHAGRRHADLEPMIGMFVNSFAMRNYPAPHKTFREFLDEVKERTIAAFDNQDYQFELLVEKVVTERNPGRNPLFDVMFSYHNIAKASAGDVGQKNIEGLTFSAYGFDYKVAKFDLMLHGEETNEQLNLHFEYATRLFKKSTIERFALYFKEMISQLLANSFEGLDKKLAVLELLYPEERKQILENCNGPVIDLPQGETVVHLFAKQVEKKPDHIAFIDGDNRVSYRELAERSDQWADSLTAKGFQNEQIAAVMMDRSLEMAVIILATWKAGGAYIPIDPGYPQERIDYMLKDSKATILITDDENKKTDNCQCSIVNCQLSMSDCPRRGLQHSAFSILHSNHLCYVIYTSGTTGNPKGAMVEHGGMLNHMQAKIHDLQLSQDSIIVQNASHTFDISVWQFFAALLAGGKTVIYNNELILEPRKLVSRLVKDKVTVLEVVPSYLAIMFEHLPLRDSRLYLEYLVITGETLKPHIVDQWFKIYPGIPLVNAYGPTEASDDITHHIMKAPGNDRNIPIGKPVQNFSIYIIDSVMNLCPIGVTGEIWVSGAGVGRGYINRPELTAEKFDQDLWDEKDDQDKKNKSFFRGLRGAVFSKKAPLYKTGDLARWLPNGVIDFLGRKDQQVKIRGFRIELGEIENRLMQYTGIKEAVVIDKAAENGEKYLCAYYVLKKESDREIIPAVELQDYLSAALPHYMVPAYFIKLAKIPLTANGKINTRELPDPEILDHELTGIKVRYMPPQTRLEHTCADVWSDVLGIERERIGIDDNFFQSGGHSLKAVTFLSKLHRELEVKIPLVTLFNFPTIRQLAEYIGNISKTNKARYFSIEPVEKKEYYPLSPAQRRMYIAREMEPGSTVYNVFQIHELGKPDFAKLEKTFQQLIARHESLRTTFHMIHDDLVQRVNDHVPFKIESYDTDKAIENFVRPFDLAEAPLLRVGLIQNRDQYCILLVDMHHIICDGISHDVLVKDFIALYEEKEENILQPLHLQYKDYAQWLDGVKEEINRQQDYWVNQFSKPVPVLNLVTDYPRPATRDFSGSVYSFALEKQPSEKLREYASRMNITLYILFLAIYYILIYKLTLQEDIVIGTPVSGRNHPDLEKIIGMFVNILALRNSPRGDKTFHDWLNELKETTLEAFANQDYQFDELVERVGGNKDAGRNPLFDISFGFETLERREELIPGQPIPQQETSTQRGEDLRPVRRPHKTTRFDLSLYGVDTGAHLVFSFEYSITLFKPERIETFSQYYKEIISSILNNPRERIDQIQISHQLSRASVDFLQDEAIMAEF